MKKNLIAIAVGAALVTPGVAMAEAKVYGKFMVSLVNQKDELGLYGTANDENVFALRDTNNASRFGLKGKDDLGIAGLEGFYQMEWGVDPFGEESDVFSRRNIFVGIRGGFGSLKFGFHDTMIKDAGAFVDVFNDTEADITFLMTGESRDKNLITYTTPKIADAIELAVAIQPGESRVATDDLNDVEDGIADTIYASAKYETEMVTAMIAYAGNQLTNLKLDRGTVGSDIIRASVLVKPVTDLEIGALYQVADGIDQDGLDADGEPSSAADAGELSDSGFVISAAYTMEALKIKGMYGMNSGDQNDKDRSEIALGVDYKLNKSTYVSAYYVTIEDDAGAGEKPASDTFGTQLVYSF